MKSRGIVAFVTLALLALPASAQPAPGQGEPSPYDAIPMAEAPDPPSPDVEHAEAEDAEAEGADRAERGEPGPEAEETGEVPTVPPAEVGASPEGDVDVITSAGRPTLPAKYEPSIVLEGERVVWDPRWKKFGLANWIASGAGLAIGFASLAIPPDPERWASPNQFDWAARKAILPDTLSQRQVADDASDILLTVSVNTLLIDTLVVTWWGHDADTVAYQMALINIETLAFNTALQGLVSGFVSRQRPFARAVCGDNDDEKPGDCASGNRFRSFYSGHTSAAFAAAGATCMHHAYLPLYGGGAGDVAACGIAVAVAGATGTLRMVGDRHWLSDVLVGAGVGTFTGLAVPYFFHYRGGAEPEVEGDTVSVNLVPTPTGALMTGVF